MDVTAAVDLIERTFVTLKIYESAIVVADEKTKSSPDVLELRRRLVERDHDFSEHTGRIRVWSVVDLARHIIANDGTLGRVTTLFCANDDVLRRCESVMGTEDATLFSLG
jgi:hypothetical protein